MILIAFAFALGYYGGKGTVANIDKVDTVIKRDTILKDTAYGSCVYLYKLFVANTLISKLKKVDNAISIAYSPDARTLVVGTQTSIHICDAHSGRIMD